MTTAIGFANKFYTLWQISKETRPLGNGHSYVIVHYNYIKNISFDKEKAMALYPDAIYDENLRGKTSSWQTNREVWDNVDVFRFGRYIYKAIAENEDTDYIAWYWDNVSGEHRDYVSEVLKNRGYEIRKTTHNDGMTSEYLISPDDLEKEKINIESLNSVREIIMNNDPLELTPTRNLDEFGEYWDGNIYYKFENYKTLYYNDYAYGLPLKNEKAKRIKNKTIKITDYTFVDNRTSLNIYVKDFEII